MSEKINDNTMGAITALMDGETRERVHFELAPCSNESFLKKVLRISARVQKGA